MTDDTSGTPPTAGDIQTDRVFAGAMSNGASSATEAFTSEPPLRRAASITAPLSESQLLADDFDLDATYPPHDSSDVSDISDISAADHGEAPALPHNEESAPKVTETFIVVSVEDPSVGEPLAITPATVPDAVDEVMPVASPVPVTGKLEEPPAEDNMNTQQPTPHDNSSDNAHSREHAETAQPTPPVATTSPLQEASPAPEPAARDRGRDADFARYYAVRNHFGPIALSPDQTQVAYIANTSGQFNIWRQGVNGGWPSQITTFEEESVRSLIWTTSGEIIGSADHAGGEQYELFSVSAQGGAARYLTNRPDAQYELSEEGLSPDGRYLVYSGNDRTSTDSDVLIRDMQTGETRRVLANGHFNVAINWSPDGRFVTVMDIRSNTDMHMWLLEAATGEARELLPHEDECYLAPGPWLPDSSGLYLITDRGTQFKGIARYLLATDSVEWVLKPEWDVEQLSLSADGRRLLWTLNESGRSQLHVRDNDQASLRVSGLPIGVIEYMKLSPDGKTLALRINSATAPAEVYVLSLGAIGSVSTPHLRRLTYGMLGGLAPADLIAPELVRYRTFDGREIPAWLYRPRGASESHPAPVVISIHGGPEAQERVEYRALYQFLLSRGIGVLAPNIRGSTGYGKAYQKLIHRDWGGAELKDIQATAEYARALSWVNPRKLGIYGGSFGGFATLSAVTRLPDYWAAAVDIVGPSNLLTFVRSVPPTWRRMMAAWVGDPEADADLLRERSPITYVDQIRAPLLVLQGANDPRVVKAESDQMVERLKSQGHEVEYVVFPDEGHGFTRRTNLLRGYSLTANFFERHLL
ncbi:MAG TPA: prolyl oligopeptidase family serine peptidase [Ktedonobacterales bacterium]